jgi:hypothetical protein
MVRNPIQDLVGSIAEAYARLGMRPIPRRGCRMVLRGSGSTHRNIVPDLSTYWYGAATSCMDARRFPVCTQAELRAEGESLARGFLDWFPEYRSLTGRASEVDTPELYAMLDAYDRLGVSLLELLGLLLRSGAKGPGETGG